MRASSCPPEAQRPPHTHTPTHTHPHTPLTTLVRYSAADYRDRLYREIARHKKDAKEARSARETASQGGATGAGSRGTTPAAGMAVEG